MVDAGDQIIGITQFSVWFSQLKSGVTTVENAAHSRCTWTSKTHKNVDQDKAVVIKNTRITIHEVANMLGIPFGSVQSILMVNGQWKNVWNLLIIWTGKKYVQIGTIWKADTLNWTGSERGLIWGFCISSTKPPHSKADFQSFNFTCSCEFSSDLLFFRSLAAGGGSSSKA